MLDLRQTFSKLLDLLSPPACVACDGALSTCRAFCATCGQPSAYPVTALAGVPVLVAGRYGPPLSTAIQRFKYGGRPELARPLAQLLVPSLTGLVGPLTLVPVPLHARRLASRGYNQAALLASELSSHTCFGYRPRLLKREKEMDHQVGKTRTERRENAAGAFELRQPTRARVVLVDDVITTGSTVRACAQALATGSIELAAVVALARAEAS